MTSLTHNPDENRIFTIPNILSFLRICLIPLIVVPYLVLRDYLWAGSSLVLSGITDVADGFIARHFNMVSRLGKILDPIADKLTQAATMICLAIKFPLMILPLVILAIKEFLVGISGMLVIKRTGNIPAARWHGKAATFLLYGVMVLHIFWGVVPTAISAASIALCTVMIFISFACYTKANLTALIKMQLPQFIGGIMKSKLRTIYNFIANPRLLSCILVAWFITNGWSYVMFAVGTHYEISWMIAVSGAYLAFLWLPVSPEKLVTFAIAIALLRWLFPDDNKTLAVLKQLYDKAKKAIENKREKHMNKKEEKKQNSRSD